MEESKECQLVVVLPYIEGIGQQTVKVLSQVEIRSVFKAQPWKWNFCRGIKDVILKEDHKGVVYEVSCKDCSGQYVGEGLRTMVVRMQECTATLGMAELTSQLLLSMQLCKDMKSTGPPHERDRY